MRWTIASFVLFVVTVPLLADDPPAAAGKPAQHRIVAVTIYQNNALVTRDVTVPEGQGVMELIVSPLPPQTVANSLYAEGTDGTRVLNTRYRTVAIKEDTREEVRKLEAALKQAQQTGQRIQADLKLLEQNQQFLGKMEGFTGVTLQHLTDKGMLSAETMIALAKYIMQTRSEKTKEAVALQQQLQDNAESVEFIKRQLAEKAAGTSRQERDAVIVVDKANAGVSKVRLNYLVSAVSWHPQYKLRAGKDKEPVLLEYLAAVHQRTGEDWNNVTVALSTAQPLLNAAPPDLKMLAVSAIPAGAPGQTLVTGQFKPGDNRYKELHDKAQSARGQAQELSNTRNWTEGAKAFNDAAAEQQCGELLASRDDIVAVQRESDGPSEGPSVTYRMRSRLSLPSRTDEQVFEVARLELSPEYFYKAVPVLTSHVYRQANLVNKSEFVLLPGEATMYMGTDFVGRMHLPLVAIGKQFTVGFGVDPQLQVQRTLVNKTRTTTGGNQVLTFDYRILVNSYKSEPVKMQVWERLPKGEAQAIAVSLVSQKPDLSADAMYVREDKPKNLLRWDVTVEPIQHGEKAFNIDYEYRLELDKQMQIGTVVAK